MNLFEPKPKDTPYRDSREYLDRQQSIDYLLVLAKLLEPGMEMPNSDIRKTAGERITQILEKLK